MVRYAVHSHIGVFWDGGARLLGVYRWLWLARITCFLHVFKRPLRMVTVVAVRADVKLADYHTSTAAWHREAEAASPLIKPRLQLE